MIHIFTCVHVSLQKKHLQVCFFFFLFSFFFFLFFFFFFFFFFSYYCSCLSPCHTRTRSRGVCVAFLNFLNFSRTPRELQEKMILFVKKASHGVLTASSWRPRRVQGVPTEFSLRSAEFYVAFHGACTTFSLRFRGALGVRTALPRRSHRASTAF